MRRRDVRPIDSRRASSAYLPRRSVGSSPRAAQYDPLRMTPAAAPERILIVLPNWVGDVVLATPLLAAVRAARPAAQITLLGRSYVHELLAGGGWHDALLDWPRRQSPLTFGRTLKKHGFTAALLLTNSFRTALATWLAGIPQRIGYARDARGVLLTDRLQPSRVDGRFQPISMLPYYAAIAERFGCAVRDRRLRLGVTPDEEQAAAALRAHYALGGPRSYAIINPGAAYGAAKCWLPERFAGVCDHLREEFSLTPVIVGAPGEAALMNRIAALATRPVVCMEQPGTTLGSLKPLIRDAAVLVCNDTGPRHFGNAFGVPTVTIFGPTDQRWTDTDSTGELKLQAAVECGPCQLRLCPLDHRCMRGITVARVVTSVAELLHAARRQT